MYSLYSWFYFVSFYCLFVLLVVISLIASLRHQTDQTHMKSCFTVRHKFVLFEQSRITIRFYFFIFFYFVCFLIFHLSVFLCFSETICVSLYVSLPLCCTFVLSLACESFSRFVFSGDPLKVLLNKTDLKQCCSFMVKHLSLTFLVTKYLSFHFYSF